MEQRWLLYGKPEAVRKAQEHSMDPKPRQAGEGQVRKRQLAGTDVRLATPSGDKGSHWKLAKEHFPARGGVRTDRLPQTET